MDENYKDVVKCERFLGIETPDPIYGIGEKVRNRESFHDTVLVVRDVCWNSQDNGWEYGLNFDDGRSYSNTMPESWIEYPKVSVWASIRKFFSALYNDAHIVIMDRPPK